MAATARTSIRDTAALADKAPTKPLMPKVVVHEEAIALADLDTESPEFAMRLDLRAQSLADELRRDGQLNAIHVWSGSGEAPYQILAGHRRTAAAKLLGWPVIRAVVHRNLTRDEAWRLAWKDNAERRTLSQQDRWWLVARLIGEGRNQVTVAALLGIDKSSVSRDAGWTRLPEAVRDQVGRDGFSHAHAVELIPYEDRLDAVATAKLLLQYRNKPCDRSEFRKNVTAHFKGRRKRWPKALKVTGERAVVDLKNLDVDGLTPGQINEALGLFRRVVATLEAKARPE